jgi:hypothetical protein
MLGANGQRLAPRCPQDQSHPASRVRQSAKFAGLADSSINGRAQDSTNLRVYGAVKLARLLRASYRVRRPSEDRWSAGVRVMSMSVGASSNALSYLQSLLAQGTAGTGAASSASDPLSALMQTLAGSDASSGQASSVPAGATTGTSPFGNDTMAALISLQGQSANGLVAQSPSQLFAKIDTNGDGQISKSEFENALASVGVDSSTADSLYAKLDTNGDGSVSQSEFDAGAAHGHHHHAHGGGGAKGGSSSADALLSATGADGATTQTATNPDGSTTTTITYADGSTIASTSPAASASGSSASNGTSSPDISNLLKQLVQMQSQLLTAAGATLSTLA